MTHSPQDMFASVLTDKSLKEIARLAEIAFDTVINHWMDGAHHGKGVFFRAGFFVQSPQGYVPYEFMTKWLCGNKNKENQVMYRGQSAEKVWRLLQQFMLHGHISAEQSKVEGENYKGAILIKVHLGPEFHELNDDYAIMFLTASGVPDDGDEAGLVHLADMIGERVFEIMHADDLTRILELSQNSVYQGPLLRTA